MQLVMLLTLCHPLIRLPIVFPRWFHSSFHRSSLRYFLSTITCFHICFLNKLPLQSWLPPPILFLSNIPLDILLPCPITIFVCHSISLKLVTRIAGVNSLTTKIRSDDFIFHAVFRFILFLMNSAQTVIFSPARTDLTGTCLFILLRALSLYLFFLPGSVYFT